MSASRLEVNHTTRITLYPVESGGAGRAGCQSRRHLKPPPVIDNPKLAEQGTGNSSFTRLMAADAGSLQQAKLVLLGDMGAGKSSLVMRFVKQQFYDYQVRESLCLFVHTELPEPQ